MLEDNSPGAHVARHALLLVGYMPIQMGCGVVRHALSPGARTTVTEARMPGVPAPAFRMAIAMTSVRAASSLLNLSCLRAGFEAGAQRSHALSLQLSRGLDPSHGAFACVMLKVPAQLHAFSCPSL